MSTETLADKLEHWIAQWDFEMREHGPNPAPLADYLAERLAEPNDEQVERMARSLFRRTHEGRSGFTWPVNGEWGRKRDVEDARRILTFVLNGPKPTRSSDHRRRTVVIEIEVIELGEDGDAWFVTGVTGKGQAARCEAAKEAIDAWLVGCLASGDLADARETLAAAKARPFIGWFATGHREGELVDYRKVEPPRGLVGVLVR